MYRRVQSISKVLSHLVSRLVSVATVLIASSVLIFQSQNTAQAAGPICDHTIGSAVTTVDGNGNYSAAQPGDTICIPAGTRGPLTVSNLHGTTTHPIILINSEGQVFFNSTGKARGLYLKDSSHVRITGTGVTSQCGAPFSPGQQQCGLVFTGGSKGFHGEHNSDIELDHLEVHHTDVRGIKLNRTRNQKWIHHNAFVHHNYVHHIPKEGFYVGSWFEGNENIPYFDGLEVSYNRVEHIGWAGMDIKGAIARVKVHHNIIIDASQAINDGGLGIVTSPVGDYYNNWIESTKNDFGLKINGIGNQRIFNNVIIDSEGHGLRWRTTAKIPGFEINSAKIFNNTIINSGNNGIWVGEKVEEGSSIYDNIVVGSNNKDLEIQNSGTQIFNNLTGSIASLNFINADQNDYHLSAESLLAIDAGSAQDNVPSFDYDDNARDSSPDVGAFEFIAAEPLPEPTPPSTPPPTPTTPPENNPNIMTLAFNAPDAVVPGETFSVSVEAQEVADEGLYGTQFEVKFDPTMLSVDNLQVNPDLSLVLRSTIDNDTGQIQLVASREGQVPGLTGTVPLLTFDAVANGSVGAATLAFGNEKVSNPQAQGFDVTTEAHTILVGQLPTPEPTADPTPEPTIEPTPQPTDDPTPTPTDEPTPVPTNEPTPEPTDEPTPEPTDEPTPAPTDEPVLANVSGQVILPARANSDWSGSTVTLDNGQALAAQTTATTNADGKFNFSVAAGTYSAITASAPGYLSAVCTEPNMTASTVNLLSINLVSGDIVVDDQVDVADATAVGVSFDTIGPEITADINQDQVVDIFDLVLVSTNFGRTGPQDWSCQ